MDFNKNFMQKRAYSDGKGRSKMQKMAFILVLFLCFLGIIFAYQSTVTSFTNGLNNQNLTLNTSTNTTLYIDIPLQSYVTNITIYIQGVPLE